MSKSKIQRSQVHDKHMKYVILRLDYSGVLDSHELIRVFDKRFGGDYVSYETQKMSSISRTYRDEDLKAISKAVTASVWDIENEQIRRYKGLKNVVGDVSLDISQFYICMTIGYQGNYEGLNRYLDSFKGAITVFKNKFRFFAPKRLGIRKCRIESFKRVEDINKVFESFVFNDHNLPIGRLGDKSREYRASLESDGDPGIKVNVIRKLIPVYEDGEEEIMTSLDIDAYIDNPNVLGYRNINKIVDEVNNFEFEVYKMCMREETLLGQ